MEILSQNSPRQNYTKTCSFWPQNFTQTHSWRYSPDIDIVGDGLIFSGVATPDVETTALICHQLKVGLYHNCVEVFDAPIRLQNHKQ